MSTALTFFCVLLGFQKQEKLLPPEKHEVTVRLILVDVIVTDKEGNFVTDLSKDDFILFEDNIKVPINSLELISFEERKAVPIEEKPAEEIPLDRPSKKLVVVVDGVNSWSRHLRRGAKKIINELNSLVKLGHEVMIIHLNPIKRLEILQPFTTDEELVHSAVARAAGDIWEEKSLDSITMAQELGVESSGSQARAERKLGKPQQYENLWYEYMLSEKLKFEISIGGILAVFNMIKDIPGRKSILLISDGIPELPCRPSDNPLPLRIYDPFNILKKEKSMCGPEVIKELIRYGNTQNISIYTLDPGTFTEYFFTTSAEPPDEASKRKEKAQEKLKKVQSLRWISEETGAVSLRGAKKFDRFKQVMRTDLNYYYQLSYYPPRKIPDNKYHKIRVEVRRSRVNVRSRNGYTDYSDEEKMKMLLSSTFYNPELYKKLPFEAEFIPFNLDSNKYIPWMSIALPARKLFVEREVTYGLKTFNLHIWVKDKKRGSTYKGEINIPLNIDSSFINFTKTTDYFCFHLTGQEIEFSQREYHVIFTLYDDQTEEIGTWESSFSLPDFKETEQGAIINCVLGFLTANPEGEKKYFSLSKIGGSLEYGEKKFFPAVTNQFQKMQDASLFLQVYLPRGKMVVQPVFKASGKRGSVQPIPGELVAESWNKESKVWSGIFNLHLRTLFFGDYTLKVEIPDKEGAILSKEVKLTKLRY